jgi:NitT/TauT family transport system substrate-binding protein
MLEVPVFRSRSIAALVALAVVAGGCGSAPATPSPSPSPVITDRLTVGLGFIPSVQFAPFYLAREAGYYAELGLDVTFENKIDPDLIALVGAGNLDLGLADGTSVIPAVSQGIPIRYIATIYGQFPAVVFAKVSAGIGSTADLEGRKIGIPGRFGSSWIMLQALLGSVGLSPDDVEIVEYPDFGQLAGVSQGAVDAATGFANNEPVQLRMAGDSVTIFRVDEVTPLPGPGLIAGTKILAERPEAVRRFVAATLRAIAEIDADTDAGLDAALFVVPELAADIDVQLEVLEETIALWQSSVTAMRGFGAIDREGWAASVAFMETLGLVPNPVTVDELVDDRFLGR